MKASENIFAKLFELASGGQVLLTKQYNEDDDTDDVIESTMIEGMKVDRKASFKTEDKAQTMFDTYDKGWAEDFYKTVRRALCDDNVETISPPY